MSEKMENKVDELKKEAPKTTAKAPAAKKAAPKKTATKAASTEKKVAPKKDAKFIYTWIAKGKKRYSTQKFNNAEDAIKAAKKIGTSNPKAEEV